MEKRVKKKMGGKHKMIVDEGGGEERGGIERIRGRRVDTSSHVIKASLPFDGRQPEIQADLR